MAPAANPRSPGLFLFREEDTPMWNKPTPEELAQLPRLYSQENTPLDLQTVHMHFFIAGCDWYATESDHEDLFFGYTIINQDFQNAEWGYFSLQELSELKLGFVEVDRDLYWTPRYAALVPNIVKGMDWPKVTEKQLFDRMAEHLIYLNFKQVFPDKDPETEGVHPVPAL